MKKSVVAIIIGVIAIGALVLVLVSRNDYGDSSQSTSSESSQSSTEPSGDTAQTPATGTDQNTEQTTPEAVSVTIKNFAFSPQNITVKKGTKVTWTNQDSDRHNVYSDKDGGPKGDLLSKGASYSFTFDTVGEFDYHCEPHPYMTGKVTVTE